MKARALDWWRGRSAREQTLLLICSALAAFALAYGLAFRPALTWRKEAAAEAVARETEFRLVSNAARLAADAGASVDAGTPVRNALNDVAGAVGVELVFVNARDDGAVEAQIGSTAPEKLFAMIDALERRYGVHVTAADIARVSEGASDLRAQLTLSR